MNIIFNKYLPLILLLFVFAPQSYAEWKNTPTAGTVSNVRTYAAGVDGLRAQITLSGAVHDCGTGPTTFYFDTGKVNTEVVKAVLALAFGAMAAGKRVIITYDSTLSGGGYGWATALQVLN